MTMECGFQTCMWLQEEVTDLDPGNRAVEALAWEVGPPSSRSLATSFKRQGCSDSFLPLCVGVCSRLDSRQLCQVGSVLMEIVGSWW